MVKDRAAWDAFEAELARWRDAGRAPRFWWRDDDAHRADPALSRLIALARDHAVPLALAVIPQVLQSDMPGVGDPWVSLLQHGVDHRSRALPGEKKTEFPPHEPVEDALARLREGLRRLQGGAGAQTGEGPGYAVLPVLVPPWNRLAASALLPLLPGAGYGGLSTFGPRRAAHPAPGLVQVNTHVDIIDWRGSRGFAGEAAVLQQALHQLQAQREGRADAGEAVGWLTHHAVHDAECWDFLARLFEATRHCAGLRWCAAGELFGN